MLKLHDMNRTSVHDYPRNEVLAAMRRVLDFLEAKPDIDIPEDMGRLIVRTLARQNRGELGDVDSRAAWFERHLAALKPNRDEIVNDGEDFCASKDFGAGVTLTVYVSAEQVCEKQTETRTVQRSEQVSQMTWICPPSLTSLGFSPNQEKLRERNTNLRSFMRGAA